MSNTAPVADKKQLHIIDLAINFGVNLAARNYALANLPEGETAEERTDKIMQRIYEVAMSIPDDAPATASLDPNEGGSRPGIDQLFNQLIDDGVLVEMNPLEALFGMLQDLGSDEEDEVSVDADTDSNQADEEDGDIGPEDIVELKSQIQE